MLGAAERVVARERDDEVRPQQAEVEADRAVEAELAVEGARRAVLAHHHAAGVEVAVDQRLAAGHERVLGLGGRGADRRRLQALGRRADLLLEPVALGARERLGEHEVLGDLAQLGRHRLGREQLQRLRLDPEQRGVEGEPADVAAHLLRRLVVALAVGQRGAPDAMVGEVLDGEDVALGVEGVEGRDQLRREAAVLAVRARLGDRPARGERPLGPDQAHVGQRLLEHDARARSRPGRRRPG